MHNIQLLLQFLYLGYQPPCAVLQVGIFLGILLCVIALGQWVIRNLTRLSFRPQLAALGEIAFELDLLFRQLCSQHLCLCLIPNLLDVGPAFACEHVIPFSRSLVAAEQVAVGVVEVAHRVGGVLLGLDEVGQRPGFLVYLHLCVCRRALVGVFGLAELVGFIRCLAHLAQQVLQQRCQCHHGHAHHGGYHKPLQGYLEGRGRICAGLQCRAQHPYAGRRPRAAEAAKQHRATQRLCAHLGHYQSDVKPL